MWLPPPKKYRHGKVRSYIISFARGNCLAAEPFTTTQSTRTTTSGEAPKSEEALFFREPSLTPIMCQWRTYTVDETVSGYVFGNLSKWTNYSVYVVCRTVGDSDRSKVWTNSTDEDSKLLVLPLVLILSNT